MAERVDTGPKVTIGVPKETSKGETRIALTPDGVKKYVAAGHKVLVETGAGTEASFPDNVFSDAGATVVAKAGDVYAGADIILKVQKPSSDELEQLREGTMLIAFLQPMVNTELVEALQKKRVIALSMDAIPRTTRAQYMDALSSQATIGGYKAVLIAANLLPKFFPLLTTAAGNIPPAKVLIVGAGVAGLMAIGTARRLGAVVEAYDARAVVKEQVESLGARFVEIDTGADLAGAGGYAKEASEGILRKQQEGLAARAPRTDVIITTAAVPGRPAPRLITADAVSKMPVGSVIVDLAAETGGNCELTKAGEIIVEHGVTIVGAVNLPAQLPVHASQMYSKNIQNLLALLIGADGQMTINMDDEIIAGTIITRDGEVIHEGTKQRMNPAPAAASAGS
jgi:H+-translocating NAD(P) transhydrogenase subunit alpha